ncbi:MAG: class I SAM-dependent methyltransferase [Bradyrhizobiaceae bacterium]|nr:class I SAM-dependent methyltransferase [Bradyrhizobiaceae bacterium]
MTAAVSTARMNRIYRRQRHIYDATRKYFLLGRDRLIAGLDAGAGMHVLEIGCGTGRNLIVAAQRYPGARFYGIDISTEMLTSAYRSIEQARLAPRIRVAHGDATSFDANRLFATEKFDRIFLSYTLSMIPRWQSAIDRAVLSLAPGGELHIVDFGGQAGLPRWFRSGLRRWIGFFHVAPRDTLEAMLSAQAVRLGARLTVERPYRDYAQYARLKKS